MLETSPVITLGPRTSEPTARERAVLVGIERPGSPWSL